MLDLRRLHEEQARRWRREAARKLEQGRGTDGRFLRPKKRPNGRPLGFGKTRRGVPGRLRRSPIRAFLTGFDVFVGLLVKDRVFDTGRRNQPPRPYAGLSQAQIERNAQELADELAKEGVRLGVFRRRGR